MLPSMVVHQLHHQPLLMLPAELHQQAPVMLPSMVAHPDWVTSVVRW
jgi:hypothetical protein